MGGLAPGTTARAMGLVDSLLPGPGDRRGATGRELADRPGHGVLDALTTLGERARARFNEP